MNTNTDTITIQLNSSDSTGKSYRFRPGETISGSVTIYPDQDINCKHLYIRLFWQTRGRGTRYWQKIEEQDVFQGELRQGMPRTFDFSFILPLEPWSYEGHYISIDWAVEVQIDVPWKRDLKQVETFLMYPDPPTAVEEGADSTW